MLGKLVKLRISRQVQELKLVADSRVINQLVFVFHADKRCYSGQKIELRN